MKTTTWRPDTCDCVIEYEWDEIVSENDRTHTIKKIVKPCKIHEIISKPEDHFVSVVNENKLKNQVIALVEANTTKEVSAKTEWSFNANRELVITNPSFSAADKLSLQSLSDSTLGEGKAKIG